MFVYGCVMKEQSKPSKVNTVLLVIVLVINLVFGIMVFTFQQEQAEKVDKIYSKFSTVESDGQYNKEQLNRLVDVLEEQQQFNKDLLNELR